MACWISPCRGRGLSRVDIVLESMVNLERASAATLTAASRCRFEHPPLKRTRVY